MSASAEHTRRSRSTRKPMASRPVSRGAKQASTSGAAQQPAGGKQYRRSEALAAQRSHHLQGKFNGGTFVRVFLGHLFFPFSLPFVIGCDGMVAAANFEFVFVGTFGTILNSYIMPIGMWVLLAMSMMFGNTDGRTHLLTLMAVASYVTRLFVIALKYSLLSSVDLARLMTRRLQSAQSSEWLLGGWGEPTSRCLRDQLLQAALAGDVANPAERTLWFSTVCARDFQEMLDSPHGRRDGLMEGPGWQEGWISTQNLVLAMFHKAQTKVMRWSRTVVMLLTLPLPGILWVSLWFAPPAVPYSFGDYALLAAGTINFTYFAAIMTTLLMIGQVDYRRRKVLFQMFSRLIESRSVVKTDADGNPYAIAVPPLVPLSVTHNIRQLIEARTLVKRMGYMYRLRIQVVLAVWLVALVAIIIALVVATIVGWHLAAVVSIMAVYVLVLVLRAVAIIILDGDAANNCVTGLRRTMLEAQTGLLQWVAAHSHGRNHARCTRLREDFILQACTGRCDMSKPNHAHHSATKSRSGAAAPDGDVELKAAHGQVTETTNPLVTAHGCGEAGDQPPGMRGHLGPASTCLPMMHAVPAGRGGSRGDNDSGSGNGSISSLAQVGKYKVRLVESAAGARSCEQIALDAEKHGVWHYDARLAKLGVGEVKNAVLVLQNCVAFLEQYDYLHPITFLGLRARLAVLVTAGTLVLSASSVGLRNVAVAAAAWLEREVSK